MKVVKIRKDDLLPMSVVSYGQIDFDKSPSSFRTIDKDNVVKLCVYHMYDSNIEGEYELQFVVEFSDSHVPFVKQEEYATVVRKKITINNSSLYGDDFSKFSPSLISSDDSVLPMGFEELKGVD